MFKEFPIELRELKCWVGCRQDSKVPIKCIPDNGIEDECASTTNSSTWQTYENAKIGLSLSFIDYFGFVFTEENGLIGIDIDTGKNEDGSVSDLAQDIIEHCKSYTEESRSGRGYHIILKGTLPFLGRNNKNGVEIYKGGRYFVMTGKNDFYYDIIENQKAIDYIVSTYFPDFRPSKENANTKQDRFYSATYNKPVKGRISLKPLYSEIKQGTRNMSMLSLAGQLKAQGMQKGETYRELLRLNQELCKPPLGRWEIENLVESCYRYK